jgi:hypothetical protein
MKCKSREVEEEEEEVVVVACSEEQVEVAKEEEQEEWPPPSRSPASRAMDALCFCDGRVDDEDAALTLHRE